MKIDELNKNNELPDIHNSDFYGFSYRENDKILFIELLNFSLNKSFKIQFQNVLVLNCEMCQFLGRNISINDWKLSQEDTLIKNITEKQKSNEKKYNSSLLSVQKKYIEITINLKSGDNIEIVCESIDFEEREINSF